MTSADDRKELIRRLMVDGVMEYVSVPWDNHRCGGSGEHTGWTMNLALWFVHVLTGNGHEVLWDYDALASLTLNPELHTPIAAPATTEDALGREDSRPSQQELLSMSLQSYSRKRGRDALDEDPIHYSFSESQIFATQVLMFHSIPRFTTALTPELVNRLRGRPDSTE